MKLPVFKIVFLIVLITTGVKSYSINYYVSASTGNNSYSGLSIDKALKTLQKAADKTVAGDTVYVMNGTYLKDFSSSSDVVIENSSGTADKWIVWMNYPGHKPVISFDCWRAFSIQGSYIEVNGLIVKGNNSNLTIEQALNQPKSCANPSGSYDGRFNGNGISADGRNGKRFHHLKVKNCTVYDCGGAGISFIQSDYITIENNIVYNCSWYTLWSTSGISLWQNWNSDDETGLKNVIRKNICYGNRQFVPAIAFNCGFTDGNGIIIDDSENTQNGSTLGSYIGRTLIENNIVYKNGGSGIHTYKSKHVDIINNTAYLNNQSAELNGGQIFPNASDDIRIFNNILVAPANKRINSNYSNGKSIIYSNNLHFGGNATAITGANLVKGDPMFADASNNDFRLQKSSPAIDRGIDSLPGCQAPSTDFDLNPRPFGKSCDIGAFEYSVISGIGSAGILNDNYLNVYPNPASCSVTVSWNSANSEITQISMLSMQGEIILKEPVDAATSGLKSYSLDTGNFPAGMYILQVNNGEQILSEKLIIR